MPTARMSDISFMVVMVINDFIIRTFDFITRSNLVVQNMAFYKLCTATRLLHLPIHLHELDV